MSGERVYWSETGPADWTPMKWVPMVICPVCDAQAGKLCINPDGTCHGSAVWPVAHTERMEATLALLARGI